MAQLTIEIPDDTRVKLETQANEGGFRSIEQYAEAVLNATVGNAEDQPGFEDLLLQRVRFGPASEMTDASFDAIRGRLEAEIARRRQP